MKSKIIITALILQFTTLPALAGDCGYLGSTYPESGVKCTCYGIKYNPEPEMVGARHYKCIGHCSLSSCKGFGGKTNGDVKEYIDKITNPPKPVPAYQAPVVTTPPEPLSPEEYQKLEPVPGHPNVFADPNHPNPLVMKTKH